MNAKDLKVGRKYKVELTEGEFQSVLTEKGSGDDGEGKVTVYDISFGNGVRLTNLKGCCFYEIN